MAFFQRRPNGLGRFGKKRLRADISCYNLSGSQNSARIVNRRRTVDIHNIGI
jgi:hypothetical protein